MKRWDEFYTVYLYDVQGATYFAAANELRRAAQEFCDRAKVWRTDLDPVLTTAGNVLYDFDISGDQEVVKLLAATLDGRDIPVLRAADRLPGFAAVKALNAREFILSIQPVNDQKIVTTVILKPSHAAAGIDDHLYAQYAEQISWGARSRLYMAPDKPYTNPDLALMFEKRFRDAIADANWRAEQAYSAEPVRTQPQFL